MRKMDIGSNSFLPQGKSHVGLKTWFAAEAELENMERKYLQSSKGKVVWLKTFTLNYITL